MSTTFSGQVQQIGERLVVRLPQGASSELPSRGQVAVEARVTGGAGDERHDWSTVIEPDGRKGHWLAVDAELQAALSLRDGDRVEVKVEPAAGWPEPELPEDLDAALADAPDIADSWADITPMARWEWVRWVGATKNPDTRERRIEVSVDKLRKGSRRPCCFDLSSCTDPELAKSGKLIEVDPS